MISDEKLLAKIINGDSKAFESLFLRHKNKVYGLSLRILGAKMLAEENSQEVWIKVVEGASQYKELGSVQSWILSITRNQALNTLRKRGWEEELSPELESQLPDLESSSFQKLQDFTDINKLKLAIDKLPDRQRVALVLWLSEEMSYSEIAQELRINENALKVLLFRAKENLKNLLEVPL
jgi:RNA polymerase sigma-70 factor (ECF subfamily)